MLCCAELEYSGYASKIKFQKQREAHKVHYRAWTQPTYQPINQTYQSTYLNHMRLSFYVVVPYMKRKAEESTVVD